MWTAIVAASLPALLKGGKHTPSSAGSVAAEVASDLIDRWDEYEADREDFVGFEDDGTEEDCPACADVEEALATAAAGAAKGEA
jgi:hypothetical protein